MPAVERYDGPAFRVLRRYLQRQQNGSPDVFILSAKWGLISGDTPLPYYDQRMTARRATVLRERVRVLLRAVLKPKPSEIFFLMSESYFQLIDLLEISRITDAHIYAVRGGRGQKLSALYDWLYDVPPPMPKVAKKPSIRGGEKITLRGREIECNRTQALAMARKALRREAEIATRVNSWYVQLGRSRVSPKWLVSKISGLPVSAFVTGDARRVLAQLGIKVRRATGWCEDG